MKTIGVFDLKQAWDNKEIFLVDVREPEEYNYHHIEDAYLLPLREVSIEKLPKSKPIVFYCRSGKRSSDACRIILEQEPNIEVFSLEGGILAWEQFGFAVKV